mmetsp:Transcript_22909/g.50209  ORF Transcript_22909/g.50209 Transcript_22909/m.50209 type:complete len:213 (+) Transcript_22909:98-736(+)
MGLPLMPWISRPVPLTTPTVKVWSRPKGLPMANTFCPTCKSAGPLLHMGRGLRGITAGLPSLLSCSTAMSFSLSTPTTLALYSLPSVRVTLTSEASLMTWKLVTMRPCWSYTKPDPAPCGNSVMFIVKASRLTVMLATLTTEGVDFLYTSIATRSSGVMRARALAGGAAMPASNACATKAAAAIPHAEACPSRVVLQRFCADVLLAMADRDT